MLAVRLVVICLFMNGAGAAAEGHSPSLTPDRANPSTVPFQALLEALTATLDRAEAPAIEAEFAAFAAQHRLPTDNPQLKVEYQRLRLLFEAVRDGGFWHLRWDVTDQEPSSRLIWQRWIRDPVKTGFAEPSAIAECDESSALMGMLARHMKIRNVGLFYPTWNHTISVWAPLGGKAKTALVQLPTTQIFLGCEAGFDKTTFRTQLRNIEGYPNWDVKNATSLPIARADWLLRQIQIYAAASPTLWSLVRAKRAFAMRSSMGQCLEARSTWANELEQHLTPRDVETLRALAKEELGSSKLGPREILRWLKE